MRYFAEVLNNTVTRVIVAHSKEWCETRLGGTWIETRDPYAATQADPTLEPVNYCGPGYGSDLTFPERFAPPWVQPAPDPETGIWSSYAKGDVRFHNGRLWKSTVDGNVWQPGVSAWHPEPDIEGVIPVWVMPTGAHDAYGIGDRRTHDNPNDGGAIWVYESTIVGNTTEPGRDGTFDRWWLPIERVT